jgi:ketosteroid isomerase-like protein/CheY-like chemotaxis protein
MADQPTARSGGRPQALLIEDDAAYGAAVAACLQLAGCSWNHAIDLDSAFLDLDHRAVDLVVLGSSEAIQPSTVIPLLQTRSAAPVVVIDDSEGAEVALGVGANQWVPKPFIPGALVAAIRVALTATSGSGRAAEPGLVLPGPAGVAVRGADRTVISSRADDVTLFSAAGGYERGWGQVGPGLARQATAVLNAYTLQVLAEHVSGDLACTVEIIRAERAQPGQGQPAFVDLRATSLFRWEAGEWKGVHWHADPLVDPVEPPTM